MSDWESQKPCETAACPKHPTETCRQPCDLYDAWLRQEPNKHRGVGRAHCAGRTCVRQGARRWTPTEVEGKSVEFIVGETVIQGVQQNTGNFGEPGDVLKGMLQGLMEMHRTHQQDVVRVLTQLLSLYGEASDCDTRNEAAVLLCQKLAVHIDEEPLPRL